MSRLILVVNDESEMLFRQCELSICGNPDVLAASARRASISMRR
jgi:hypothetical protein